MELKKLLHKLNRRDTRLIPHISNKFKFIFVVVLLFGAFFWAHTNFAADNQGQLLKKKQDAMYKGNNQESWIGEALSSNSIAGLNMLVGPLPLNEDGSFNVTGYIPGGAIGTTNKFISSLYNPPASGVEYIAQLKDNFLGKPAYAQGVGFKGLSPLLPLWKTLRNVVYVLSSLVFVIIGVAILLRIKISPQAVISIQNSIPKLITALILVTFSYAIAGLLIDLSYVVLSICLAFMFASSNKGFSENVFQDTLLSGGIPGISWLGNGIQAIMNTISGNQPYNLSNLTNANYQTIFNLAMKAVPSTTGWSLGTFIGNIFLSTLTGGVGSLIGGSFGQNNLSQGGGLAGGAVGGVLGVILIPIILAILLVIWLLKFYFGLIKCYITLIFKIITAPLEIGLGALPNTKIGFGSWLTGVIANLAVFPISILFLVFINYLMELIDGKIWMPSALELPLLLTNSGGLICAGIGLAGLGMLAKLPQLVPEAIFQIKPSPFGTAMGEGYKVGSGIARIAKEQAITGGMRRLGLTYENSANTSNNKGKPTATKDEVRSE